MASHEAYIVTTTRKERELEREARARADALGLEFAPRKGKSFDSLFNEYAAKAIYVVTTGAPVVRTRGGKLFFHENTSGRRLKTDTPDPLVRATGLGPGDRVLDCTLGLACDALVVASQIGGGEVVGLESNLLLHALASEGLREYEFTSPRLAEAASRIKPVFDDHDKYLHECEEDSFDVVYFDPFFEKTVPASPSMRVMREAAEVAGLSAEAIESACRVARRKVVIKCRRGVFGEIEFDESVKAGNRVIYGVINTH